MPEVDKTRNGRKVICTKSTKNKGQGNCVLLALSTVDMCLNEGASGLGVGFKGTASRNVSLIKQKNAITIWYKSCKKKNIVLVANRIDAGPLQGTETLHSGN